MRQSRHARSDFPNCDVCKLCHNRGKRLHISAGIVPRVDRAPVSGGSLSMLSRQESSLDKTIASTAIATVLLGTFAAAAFVYSGAFNVAATDPHSPPVTWLLETARVRSIKAHAAGIEVPPSFEAQNNVQDAAGHFVAHCATCHGAPGVDRNDFADRMYPRPPDLTDVSKRYSPAELFWILKNGIKMIGMPSMADDGDDLL
jgi:cytochrome c553